MIFGSSDESVQWKEDLIFKVSSSAITCKGYIYIDQKKEPQLFSTKYGKEGHSVLFLIPHLTSSSPSVSGI